VFGALAGLIAAVLVNAQPCHTDVCDLRLLDFFALPPFGALIGGIVGTILPASERWEPVAAQPAVQRDLGFVPREGLEVLK
jgi:hypothetical protein